MSAAVLQAIHRSIYQILRDTGRRPGEIVNLKIGCVEVIDGRHNLVYDNHRADRLRRRLPINSIPTIRVDGSSTATTVITHGRLHLLRLAGGR